MDVTRSISELFQFSVLVLPDAFPGPRNELSSLVGCISLNHRSRKIRNPSHKYSVEYFRSCREQLESANFALRLGRCRIDTVTQSIQLCPAPSLSTIVFMMQNPPFHAHTKKEVIRTSRTPTQHPWFSCHHCEMVSASSSAPLLYQMNIPKFEMLATLQC